MSLSAEAELVVESLGARGDGLATFAGERVYVPFSVPGDRVRVRLARDGDDRLVGRVVAVLAPGAARAAPACRHFGECGGCALQHVAAEAYRDWKFAQLHAALARQGVEPGAVEALALSPPGSRRRADLTALGKPGGVALGFNARASHRVIDLAVCPVLRPRLAALIGPLREALAPLLKPGERAELRLAETDSGVDLLFVTAAALGAGARERLVAFAERHDLARVAKAHPKQAGSDVVVERRPVRLVFAGHPVGVPPGAFFQATAEGEAALASFVRGALAGAKRVADLYAGLGTFSLPLAAAGARVDAFDESRPALAALAAAARAAMLAGLATEARDLDKRPLGADSLGGYDAVLFDPPRAGAKAQAALLAGSRVPRVVAVSCHPGTFARDARLLIDGGYTLEAIRPVDQFLWSPHLELAALFRRS
jgi:23S rRNA (uracil1939-C5)-methyltransferase